MWRFPTNTTGNNHSRLSNCFLQFDICTTPLWLYDYRKLIFIMCQWHMTWYFQVINDEGHNVNCWINNCFDGTTMLLLSTVTRALLLQLKVNIENSSVDTLMSQWYGGYLHFIIMVRTISACLSTAHSSSLSSYTSFLYNHFSTAAPGFRTCPLSINLSMAYTR